MRFKNVYLTFFLALAVMLPALSEVAIEEINVRRAGGNVNIRVVVNNPGPGRQPGPVVIDLSVRQNATQEWIPIKRWDNITTIQPGYRVARDYFEENNQTLAAFAARGEFDVRVVVRTPGGVRDIEAVHSWRDRE